ncbi:TPA: DUF2523 domain-containing protein [Vibrio vulnificus]|nr:DUF2523 domain-containing protein [Vibrio vulnificus]HAV6901195.1 DUF2523 domain-containing protein [Vibrio vulnificus]
MINLFRMFGALAAGNFVARILLALGVSFVTFQGFDVVLTSATSSLKALFTGMPGDVAALLGLADVDFAINLLLSAYAARVAMMAMRQMRLFK